MKEDKELLSLFRSEATGGYAFNLIVRKYQKALYWQIRRMVGRHEDADDILQEVFIKAWKGLPEFRSESGLHTWLYRISLNETISFLRKKRLRSWLSLSGHETGIGNELKSDEFFSGDEFLRKLHQAVLSLPPRQRAVFNLRYHDEMPYEEMARIMGRTTGALKASFHHAVNKIKKQLSESGLT